MEKELLDNTESMIRLKVKSKLIKDVETVFEFLSKKEQCLTGRFLRFTRKQLFKDFKAGIKQINKKISVFVELPEYEEKGSGMYQVNNEIEVSSDITAKYGDIVEMSESGIIKGRAP